MFPPAGAQVKRMQRSGGQPVDLAATVGAGLSAVKVGSGVWKPKKGLFRSLSSEKRLRREHDVQLPSGWVLGWLVGGTR